MPAEARGRRCTRAAVLILVAGPPGSARSPARTRGGHRRPGRPGRPPWPHPGLCRTRAGTDAGSAATRRGRERSPRTVAPGGCPECRAASAESGPRDTGRRPRGSRSTARPPRTTARRRRRGCEAGTPCYPPPRRRGPPPPGVPRCDRRCGRCPGAVPAGWLRGARTLPPPYSSEDLDRGPDARFRKRMPVEVDHVHCAPGRLLERLHHLEHLTRAAPHCHVDVRPLVPQLG